MLRTPLSIEERRSRIASNARRFAIPRLEHAPEIKRPRLSLCGFGPSLARTWGEIDGAVMSCSGAHDFLIERGIVPKWHVETDPRQEKVRFVRRSHPDVTYLINSQCHPAMFETLAGRRVLMWHGFTDDDKEEQLAILEAIEPGVRLLGGGTNVGMRAIVVARELGYTAMELHGMDCCYENGRQWAGEHGDKRHHCVTVEVEGERFETSDVMLQSTDDFLNLLPMLRGCSFRIHGEGLLRARLGIYLRDRPRACSVEWWKLVSP